MSHKKACEMVTLLNLIYPHQNSKMVFSLLSLAHNFVETYTGIISQI